MPVGLIIDNKVYRDGVDISTAEFWAMFPSLKEQPSTAAGNPGDFLRVFQECGKQSPDMVCILVSKAMTATYESAFLARKMARAEQPELNIEIIDSRTSAGALGFVVMEAARAAQQGKSLEEVVAITRDLMSRVVYVSALDTLSYLIKTGRAPRNITGIGERLDVKPIIGFVDDSGMIDVIARVRGKPKSLQKLVDLVDEYADTSELHCIINYSNSREEAEELKTMLHSRYRLAELHVSEYSPVMCSSTGPIIGISFYS